MGTIRKPVLLDETGKQIKTVLDGIASSINNGALIGPKGESAGFGEITATVDDISGDPSVEVTTSGSDSELNIDFSFHGLVGLKGEDGSDGEPGSAAGFGEITAVIENTSDDPAVDVVTDGPDTAKNIQFKFSGIKGDKGDPGGPAVEADGLYGFDINEEGHLILGYTGDEPPAFSLEADGHLYYDVPPKLDLGQVSRGTNPNLLDNWYFVGGGFQREGRQFPINQKREIEYSGKGYTIDRWKSIGVYTKLTIEDDYITLSSLSEDQAKGITQYLEFPKNIIGKHVTYSALVRTNDLHCGLYYGNSTDFYSAVCPASGEWELVTMDIASWPAEMEYVGLMIERSFSGSIDIKATKLELGGTQTLAHQDENGNWVLNDLSPNFQQELAKCQAHQFAVTRYTGNWERIIPSNIGTDHIDVFIPLPVSPRIAPSPASISQQIGVGRIEIEGVSDYSGWSCNYCNTMYNGLQIRLYKEKHGVSPKFITIYQGTLFDFNL